MFIFKILFGLSLGEQGLPTNPRVDFSLRFYCTCLPSAGTVVCTALSSSAWVFSKRPDHFLPGKVNEGENTQAGNWAEK